MSDISDNEKPNYGTFGDAEKIRRSLNELPIDNSILEDKPKKVTANPSDVGKGLVASMSIVSGVLVGGLLGYGLDIVFNTKPFFMVIMFPIGMIAGFRNMLRTLDNDKDKH